MDNVLHEFTQNAMKIYSTKSNYDASHGGINKINFQPCTSQLQASINHLKTHYQNHPIICRKVPLLTY
jgi:hypothetical protein